MNLLGNEDADSGSRWHCPFPTAHSSLMLVAESILNRIKSEKVERRKAKIEKKARAQQSDSMQESATL
jgi:hypothetical protein